MRKIAASEYHPILSFLPEGWEYLTPIPSGFPDGLDAILLVNPTLKTLIDDDMKLKGRKILRIAIAEPYRELLFQAIFPSLYVINPHSSSAHSDLCSALSGERCERRIRFTDSEKRILDEIQFGLTDKELSLRLSYSLRKVRRLKSTILSKTGLVSSSQLSVYAFILSELNTRSSSNTLDKESHPLYSEHLSRTGQRARIQDRIPREELYHTF